MTKSVFVVEDDLKTASLLSDYLNANGYAARIISNGLEAIAAVKSANPSAILLDLNLPGCDGTEVCQRVRQFSKVPIIMVTARVDQVERLIGLEIGADDYICKPFSPKEVMARLAAVLRRSTGEYAGPNSNWLIDESGLRISYSNNWLPLTPAEFRILRALLEQPGRVFARDQLLDKAHPDFRDVNDRAIDSHIKNIRKKIVAAGAQSDALISIYGVGYRFTPQS